ncbi:MAG: UDP-N-acetylglucosamine 2-epimerase (non-hydrolyzing) [Myxococcota bacterium]
MMRKILCVVGTRPEAIKMAPVIQALEEDSRASVCLVATAQHRELLDQVFSLFGFEADVDLDLMHEDQTLGELSARLLEGLDAVFAEEKPDTVVAQGDTTTALITAMTAFYRGIPFGHVEAGLRTGNMESPFPEEMNRVLTSRLAHWHFAPTERARSNLLREGIAHEQVYVTGNTVIDALLQTVAKNPPLEVGLDPSKKLILLTAHRRENFGARFDEVLRALRSLVELNPDIEILYPLHPNPNVAVAARRALGGHARIILCEPLAYGSFVAAMKRAHLILTDSGGVQEEAPALATPVLVLRDETERPEAVEAGVVKLVGPDHDRILKECTTLLREPKAYAAMARGVSPYGDGKSAARIVEVLLASG